MKDSIDKIVTSYFACMNTEPFTYKGVRYDPSQLQVAPGIFREYRCPANCGACCKAYTLDYIPSEPDTMGMYIRNNRHPFIERNVIIRHSGKDFEKVVYSDLNNDSPYCRNLRVSDGRCDVHGYQAFSCDFELLRFLTNDSGTRNNYLSTMLYTRGHSMIRVVDGRAGARCTLHAPNNDSLLDVVRKMRRLETWMDYWGIPNKCDEVIKWVNTGPHDTALVLSKDGKPFNTRRSKNMNIRLNDADMNNVNIIQQHFKKSTPFEFVVSPSEVVRAALKEMVKHIVENNDSDGDNP